ncbi:MAG: ribose 5-phosphate isomerase B [Clostridiaceae bacterium]|jgi:ribose 5-phosphate isomerase B|nr:ribose 5-phosphate isomerase B [Clostridiaceae bacterium]
MKIALGSDHGGFELKESIKAYLLEKGYEVEDFGTYDTNSVDYPAYALKAAIAVSKGKCEKGILVCSTGIGISIAANKVKGIRAALCGDLLSARLTREHNDTNVLALGAFIVGKELAFAIVDTWLKTPFSEEERHQRRIDAIAEIEKEYLK